jgi:phosphoribosylaminoimidazole-succinocarboxamide synthase
MAMSSSELSRLVYDAVEDRRREGIIIADTKFEFGRDREEQSLIDEVRHPTARASGPRTSISRVRRSRASTSSRCATISTANGGRAVERGRAPPAAGSRHATSARYLDAFRRITGTAGRLNGAIVNFAREG